MNSAGMTSDKNFNVESFDSNNSSRLSGVSWGAIFAGAAGAFSLSLVLFILGIGLGLTTVSPWGSSMSHTGHGIAALLWLTVTQLIASIVGGYLAGRLRVKWVKVHDNEVFFRDTAHGFIAWSIASLGAALFFVMPLTILISGGANVASGALSNMGANNPASSSITQTGLTAPLRLGYSIDSLFRTDPRSKPRVTSNDNDNVTRIFVVDLVKGELPDEDKSYVAQIVADRTGRSPAEEEQRVEALFRNIMIQEENMTQKAREAAEMARKATIRASLWTVIALLVGAFSASLAATYGGKLRDKVV